MITNRNIDKNFIKPLNLGFTFNSFHFNLFTLKVKCNDFNVCVFFFVIFF